MQFSFAEMWQHMGLPALIVAGVLLLMGLASLTVFVERLLTLRRSRSASRSFSAKVTEDMNAGRFDAVVAAADNFKRGHLARIVRAGLSTYRHAEQTADVSGLTPFDQTQRYMERFMEEIAADLRRGLGVLASVGSTAPFVGLLGTVLGIISAFQGIASTGSGGLSSVSAGISEALIETALGLTVAIPAVLAFNYLSTRIGREELLLKNACGELLDTIEDRAERELQSQQGKRAADGAELGRRAS
ncbi:MAG: MotA/TolQ/ExbB proton channel family protein [Deltaproteobacteria bacterium]|nr:MotA/TolQ/ExbB proton channel family protein [Deltaproteobacteria bacterium]